MIDVVKRSLLGVGWACFIAGAASPAAAQPAATPWLPSLPAPAPSGSAVPPPAAPPSRGEITARELYARIRRGVVALERNGVPTAVGTVLAGDGRVLTALSGLAGAAGADIRYADGSVAHAEVERSDQGTDLALLVPQTIAWTDGLSASDAEPLGSELRAMLPSRGARLEPASAGVKGSVEAHAQDGEVLARMLDVDVKGAPVAGAPLLDSMGRVVAVLVRACKGPPPGAPRLEGEAGAKSPGAGACQPIVVGAPVSAIRSFLTRSPAGPWLGAGGKADTSGGVRGVRVVTVAPSSPAERAALRPDDVIVAVDGAPVDTPDALAGAIGRHAVGDTVKLLVFGQDRFRDVTAALSPAPEAP